jgi:ribosomal protein S18 acetylase RimI-like enzyme
MNSSVEVRRAVAADLASVARLAAELVRMHHAVDASRFLLPENVEQGYAWWLGRELARPEARILVAERAGEIVGYAYGTREGRDWNLLLDEHGAIHDVFVAESARRLGVGKELVRALVAELEALGAPRVVLQTMVGNTEAQALFRACGFRATMIEMTRDRDASR